MSQEVIEQTIKDAAHNIRLRETLEGRSAEQMLVDLLPLNGNPVPCQMCGLIADDAIGTRRFLWPACGQCVDVLVSMIIDAKYMFEQRPGGFAYTEQKIKGILERQS